MLLTHTNQNMKLIKYLSALFCSMQLMVGFFGLANAAIRQIDIGARTIYYKNSPPNANGHFNYEFQTTNGITTKAAGNEHGFSGVIQYISSEGIPVTMTYVADADGYHPAGDYIPSIPDYVQKSLDYIRTHPMVDEKKSRRF